MTTYIYIYTYIISGNHIEFHLDRNVRLVIALLTFSFYMMAFDYQSMKKNLFTYSLF